MPRISRFVGLLLVATCGCVSYEARPLELESFVTDWRSNSLDVEKIDAYLARLSADVETPNTGSFDPSDGLSLEEAEAVALFLNPQLRSIRADAGVPLASAREAGWWPDPQLQAGVLRFANRGRSGGFGFDRGAITGVNVGGIERTPPGLRQSGGEDYIDDPWVINASLTFTIPISGRLAVAQDLSWSQYNAAWREIAIREWKLLTDVRSAWLAWSIVAERIAVSREYARRLETVSDIAGRLGSVGELKSTDARVLEIELARLRVVIQNLEIQQEQQRLDLFALLGLAPHAPVELTAKVFDPAVGVAKSEREAVLLTNHPRILAALAEYEVAEQSLRLEIREQFPDLNLGPSYTLEEGFSRVGMGIGLPIPLWNRNRQAVAEAMAERDAARVRAESTVQTVVAEMARAETNAELAAKRLELISNTLAPLVDRQITETQTLLDLGEVEVLVLREALRASLETKLDILDATLARAAAANELAQMLAPRWVTAAAPRDEEK